MCYFDTINYISECKQLIRVLAIAIHMNRCVEKAATSVLLGLNKLNHVTLLHLHSNNIARRKVLKCIEFDFLRNSLLIDPYLHLITFPATQYILLRDLA